MNKKIFHKALVTGSTSGIGYAIAKRLSQSGVEVWIHGLMPEDEGQQLAKSLEEETSSKTHFVAGDLSTAVATQAMCQQVMQESGGINILVNNAGIQYTAPTESMPPERWEQILTINLSSAFYTMHAMLPAMQAQMFGRIINIASVHGLVASIHKAPYVASKFGLVGLTRVVALENATKGITANCICPGWVETSLIENQILIRAEKHGGDRVAGIRDLLSEKQPTQKMSSPEDIAEVVYFLCSPAAHNITGIALPVDGAWTAQ